MEKIIPSTWSQVDKKEKSRVYSNLLVSAIRLQPQWADRLPESLCLSTELRTVMLNEIENQKLQNSEVSLTRFLNSLPVLKMHNRVKIENAVRQSAKIFINTRNERVWLDAQFREWLFPFDNQVDYTKQSTKFTTKPTFAFKYKDFVFAFRKEYTEYFITIKFAGNYILVCRLSTKHQAVIFLCECMRIIYYLILPLFTNVKTYKLEYTTYEVYQSVLNRMNEHDMMYFVQTMTAKSVPREYQDFIIAKHLLTPGNGGIESIKKQMLVSMLAQITINNDDIVIEIEKELLCLPF